MFDTHSDYALNKADKNAIVCPSVTGEHIRLTREDFSSEEEFLYWKDWSDNDLHKIENDGQYDSRCLTLDTQRDTPVPSAEDVLFEHISKAEKEHERATLISQIKTPHGIHIDAYDPAIQDDPVLTVVNHSKASLRIIKMDRQSGDRLPGVTFEIYKDTELFDTKTTNDNGEILLYDLEPGTYLVKEVATDDEHVITSAPQQIVSADAIL